MELQVGVDSPTGGPAPLRLLYPILAKDAEACSQSTVNPVVGLDF